MGWPSTENELEAWSPSPWKRPFESAATPGDESVTSELSDDDWLSRGSLLNELRSRSVWKVESFSNRSLAVTLTTVEVSPTVRVLFTVIGTNDRTSMS